MQQELDRAEAARAGGNEGMARVCARRAAGWTAKAYLATLGIDLKTNSVLEQMRHLLHQEASKAELREILEHLLTPKQKDDLHSDSYFPLNVDLVAEARRLLTILFPEEA
ncbi:MAG: hypothetical protein WEA61_05880 [Anaerolineales bacterium]